MVGVAPGEWITARPSQHALAAACEVARAEVPGSRVPGYLAYLQSGALPTIGSCSVSFQQRRIRPTNRYVEGGIDAAVQGMARTS